MTVSLKCSVICTSIRYLLVKWLAQEETYTWDRVGISVMAVGVQLNNMHTLLFRAGR